MTAKSVMAAACFLLLGIGLMQVSNWQADQCPECVSLVDGLHPGIHHQVSNYSGMGAGLALLLCVACAVGGMVGVVCHLISWVWRRGRAYAQSGR
jgi:hypothetical protein